MIPHNEPFEMMEVILDNGDTWSLWAYPNAECIEEYVNRKHIRTFYPNGYVKSIFDEVKIRRK